MKPIAKQQATIADRLVRMQAPVAVRETYFHEIYASSLFEVEATNHQMENMLDGQNCWYGRMRLK
jgi:hypothetical protein